MARCKHLECINFIDSFGGLVETPREGTIKACRLCKTWFYKTSILGFKVWRKLKLWVW